MELWSGQETSKFGIFLTSFIVYKLYPVLLNAPRNAEHLFASLMFRLKQFTPNKKYVLKIYLEIDLQLYYLHLFQNPDLNIGINQNTFKMLKNTHLVCPNFAWKCKYMLVPFLSTKYYDMACMFSCLLNTENGSSLVNSSYSTIKNTHTYSHKETNATSQTCTVLLVSQSKNIIYTPEKPNTMNMKWNFSFCLHATHKHNTHTHRDVHILLKQLRQTAVSLSRPKFSSFITL